MTSQRKVLANRQNGRKSCGPKTAEGKAKSCRNSLRHGLTLINRNNPQFAPALAEIAEKLCSGCQDAELREHALTIAECDLLLTSTRAQAALIIDRLRDATVGSHAKGKKSYLKTLKITFRRCKDYDKLEAFYTKVPENETKIERDLRAKQLLKAFWAPAARDEAEAILAATPDLLRLGRTCGVRGHADGMHCVPSSRAEKNSNSGGKGTTDKSYWPQFDE